MKALVKLFAKLKPYLNKYVITVAVLVAFIVFLDQNSVVRRLKLEREIATLKKEIRRYEQLRDQSAVRLESLKAGKSELERVAREEYLMKKENEDIFLISTPEKTNEHE
jgi:cell division protein DivIC